ncbi:glycosyltransferase [Candidatus Micrarchaeota archaeon]|nr:glycosyltransferase [Candidatus Micrarchaeota archaeon]
MISIIIPTLNEEQYIEKCILSFENSKCSDYEVLVVDGKSTDRTREIAESLGAKVLIQEKKRGISDARNIGLKHVNGEISAFIDADGEATKGWLDKIVGSFENNDIYAVGGPVYYGKFIYDAYSKSVFLPNHLYPITGFNFISGNNSAYKTDFLKSVDGFPDVIIEDFGLSLNMKRKNIKTRFDWDMKVILSSRRFEEKGFANTVSYWGLEAGKVLLGKGTPCKEYKRMD